MSNGPFNAVAWFSDKLLLNAKRHGDGGDSLLVLGTDNSWSRFAPLFGSRNRRLDVSTDGDYRGGDTRTTAACHMYDRGLHEVNFIYGYEGASRIPRRPSVP